MSDSVVLVESGARVMFEDLDSGAAASLQAKRDQERRAQRNFEELAGRLDKKRGEQSTAVI